MQQQLYLWVDLLALSVPLLFSFHKRIQFVRHWKAALPAIASVGLMFVLWDILYTGLGVWGFNPRYLTGTYVANLPVEEVLFFCCIPYSCLFTYFTLKQTVFQNTITTTLTVRVTYILIGTLLVLSVVYFGRLYTAASFLLLSLFLFYLVVRQRQLLALYFKVYLILLLPFFIVNGILTGTGLDEPIVWYNNDENLGIRVLTIPIEDFFYGMLLIFANLTLFEWWSLLSPARMLSVRGTTVAGK